MLTDLYLIRHGDATRDKDVPYDVAPGPGLSVQGRDEARQAATFLSGRGVRHLFVSPFRRTLQTAEQIGEQLGLGVSVRSLLTEAPHTESAAAIRARIQEFLQTLADVPYSTVGVVSHGSPLLLFQSELRGEAVDLRRPPDHLLLPTAGMWHAQRQGDGWQVARVFVPDAGWRKATVVY